MAVVRLFYFARVREAIGHDEEEIERPSGDATVGQLLTQLSAKSDAHASAFSDPSTLRFALDQAMVSVDQPIGQATELAIFPPVTGG